MYVKHKKSVTALNKSRLSELIGTTQKLSAADYGEAWHVVIVLKNHIYSIIKVPYLLYYIQNVSTLYN